MIRWNILDMDTKGTESIVILQKLEFFIAHKIYSQVKLKNFLCMLIAWLGSGIMEKFWKKLQCLLNQVSPNNNNNNNNNKTFFESSI